jgi:secreted trypsin-like serine protease
VDGPYHGALDPLQEHRRLAERLARLIAEDDEQRSVLVFGALMNVVDGVVGRPRDDGVRHVRSVLMRGAEPLQTRTRSGRRPDSSIAPAEDSLYADPVFLANASRLMGARTRIVGGMPTHEYPDCVAVGGASGWCCSGTLVAPNVVVTAGHCVQGDCCSRVSVGEDVADTSTARVIGVRHAAAHPDYRPPNPVHDLSVLILDEDAGVAPRGIAHEAMLANAVSVRLAGYGRTDVEGTTGAGRRRMVDVPLASSDPKYGADPESEFVAGAPFLDRDACSGDSGGPAYVEADDGWYLAGATSRATRSTFRRCGDGGIYTWVRAYARWIRDVPGGHWT